MSLGQLTSSALLYCESSVPSATGTVTETFTKVWEYTAWAACPTAEWPATYTIKEICTGDPDAWTQPVIPPNFIKTVVTCSACEQKTQTVTCPVEEAAQTGDVTIYGNGVTATPAWALAEPTDSPDSGKALGPGPDSGSGSGQSTGPGGNSAPGADGGLGSGSGPGTNGAGSAPGSGPGSGSGPGTNGPGSAPGSDAPAPGMGLDGSPNPDTGAGDSPVGAPNNNNSNNNDGNAGLGSSPDSGSRSSPAPDSGAGPGPSAAPAAGGDKAGGSSPTLVAPQSNAGTDAASSPHMIAGAPSLKSTLLLVVFAFVSGSIVCC